MITQGQFNRALQEINESFARLVKRVTDLEDQLKAEQSKAKEKPSKAA